MTPLTTRQQQVYDFILEFIEENGIAPSTKEIADHMGIYPNAVREHLVLIERKGFILLRKPADGKKFMARNIVVCG